MSKCTRNEHENNLEELHAPVVVQREWSEHNATLKP